MPVGDWQFWVVTACAAGAVVLMVNALRRKRRRRRPVRLTVGGEPVSRK